MSRNSKPIQNPFGEWPGFEILDREHAVGLTGKYKTPSAWWSWGLPLLLLILMPILIPASCSVLVDAKYGGDLGNMPAEAAAYLLGFWVAAWIVIAVLGDSFGRKRRLDVKMSPETIEINGTAYAREPGLNQFAIEEHEKAFSETQAARAGQAGGRVYRDAVQVVMWYGERRVPVAAFGRSDVRKAQALLRRLQYLNDEGTLEALLGMAGHVKTATPGERDDFGPARPIR